MLFELYNEDSRGKYAPRPPGHPDLRHRSHTLTMHGVTSTPDLILNAADVMSSKCTCVGQTGEHNGSASSSCLIWKTQLWEWKYEISNFKRVGHHFMKTLKRIATELFLACSALHNLAQSVTVYPTINWKTACLMTFHNHVNCLRVFRLPPPCDVDWQF